MNWILKLYGAVKNYGVHKHLLRAKAKAQRDKSDAVKDIVRLESQVHSAQTVLLRAIEKRNHADAVLNKIKACSEGIMNAN